MLGILLAAASNLVLVFADSGKKHLLTRYPALIVVWSTMLVALLVIGAFICIQGLPEIKLSELASLLPIVVALMTFSELLFMLALRHTALSVAMPFRIFGAIFLVPISFIFGEPVSLFSVSGVIISVIGSYILFRDAAPRNLSIFQALQAERGVQAMLINALIFCMLVPLQRAGAAASSPVFFVWCFLLGEWLVISSYLLFNRKDIFVAVRESFPLVGGIGALWGLGFALAFVCMSYTTALNVGLVNQLHPLLSLPIGALFFKESVTFKRTIGCLLMLLGVSVAIFSQ